MQILSATNITKSFGKRKVLSAFDIECRTGEILGIFGRNGSGKSTLLKILFGIEHSESLQLTLNGNPVRVKDVIPNSVIAYLPQDTFLPKTLKVRDIIPMYFENGEQQDRLFYQPEIHRIANTRAGSLSPGELRYFELLLVGHLSHPFLMLDEPFSMIEPLHKELIKNYLNELKASKGIIITDHYYRDVLSISDRNILLKDGKAITIESENELADNGYLPSK